MTKKADAERLVSLGMNPQRVAEHLDMTPEQVVAMADKIGAIESYSPTDDELQAALRRLGWRVLNECHRQLSVLHDQAKQRFLLQLMTKLTPALKGGDLSDAMAGMRTEFETLMGGLRGESSPGAAAADSDDPAQAP